MASGSPVATEGSQARMLDSSGGPVRVGGTIFVHPDINGAVRERIPTIIIDEHEAMAIGGGVESPAQAENELPQPQPPVDCGFLKVKPDPCMDVT